MIDIDLNILSHRLTILSGVNQLDEAPVFLGVGGFRYGGNKHRREVGYYLFLYYGSKLVHINLERNAR